MRASIGIAIILLTGCVKKVDLDELSNNPFDPGYVGANVFTLLGTDSVLVEGPGGALAMVQVIDFRVESDLFLSPATYEVRVTDTSNGNAIYLLQDPVGSDLFRYYFDDVGTGIQRCVDLQLSNSFSVSKAQRACVTL
jgi:hypothetical protein